MVPLMLQDYLVKKRLPALFEGFTLKNVAGQYVPLNIYSQYLPVKKGRKDLSHFPYIEVILLKGSDSGQESMFETKILIMTGVYDEDDNNQGYRDCLNVIQKMYDCFVKNRVFDGRYELQYPIEWETTEENYHPHYFAGLITNWSIGKVFSTDLYT